MLSQKKRLYTVLEVKKRELDSRLYFAVKAAERGFSTVISKKNNLNILARIKSCAVQGCSPELMGLGPIEASKKALIRANLSIKDIEIVELNEAFASQSLACIKELSISEEIVNLDGGAIA